MAMRGLPESLSRALCATKRLLRWRHIAHVKETLLLARKMRSFMTQGRSRKMDDVRQDHHRARADQEEMLAARAKDTSSQQAHRQLAELHRAKAGQQEPGEPPPGLIRRWRPRR
jgi:hypothetical protein